LCESYSEKEHLIDKKTRWDDVT